MNFDVGNGEIEAFGGQILSFDPKSAKYGVYFPVDGKTVYIDPVQDAEDIQFTE